MKIDPKAPSAPFTTNAPARRAGDEAKPAAHRNTPVRTDAVTISDRARSISTDSVSTERLAEISGRIRSRYYDSPAVAESVARRLLVSGDL